MHHITKTHDAPDARVYKISSFARVSV